MHRSIEQQRLDLAYNEVIKNIYINKIPDNIGLVIEAIVIQSQILKRDFTKRQLNILSMISLFSFVYSKREALIPKLMDFEITGVSKTTIKNELEKLEEMNVITWKREENLFSINMPNRWSAPYHDGYNDNRSHEIFLMNLKHSGYDIESVLANLKGL